MKKYFYSSHKIDSSDIVKVSKTLEENALSRGPLINKFEIKLSKFTNSKYAVAVNNGTSALIAAIKSLNLKKNSTIAVPNITFVATASSVLLNGYKIVLLDVSKESGLIELKTIQNAIDKYKIACLINVHLNGNIGDLKSIFKLCKKHKVKIIDDACHALGTKYFLNKKNYNICDNSFCDISTLSFHPSKLITTGEGGAILTNNYKIYKKLREICNHGYQRFQIKKKKYTHEYYKINNVGYNFRISDINCALGLNQLNKIVAKINHRRMIARIYDNIFKYNEFIEVLKIKKNVKSAYHLYPIFIKNFNKINKLKLMKKLKEKKIFTQIHYFPLNRQPLFAKKNKFFPESQIYFEKVLSIPMHEKININDAKFIGKNIIKEIIKIKNIKLKYANKRYFVN